MPSKVPLCSCRNGAPVVVITQQRTPVPAKLVITSREQGDEVMYIVKVRPCVKGGGGAGVHAGPLQASQA
jgi:hypothetical protein